MSKSTPSSVRVVLARPSHTTVSGAATGAVLTATGERDMERLGGLIHPMPWTALAFLIGAADDGRVLGFASYDQFRAGNGYVHAMEHTVILAPEAHGRGLGRALMTAIEEHARMRGGHSMVAGVSGENAAGIAFHRALGYAHVGLLPQSGHTSH